MAKLDPKPKDPQVEELEERVRLLTEEADRWAAEVRRNEDKLMSVRRAAAYERKLATESQLALHEELRRANAAAATHRREAAARENDRRRSVPKFIATVLIALLATLVVAALERAAVIDCRSAFAVESLMMMVIAWSLAMVWDRGREVR